MFKRPIASNGHASIRASCKTGDTGKGFMWAENVRRNASLAAMSEISGSMGSRTGFIKEESVFCLLPDSLDRLARVNNEHVFRDMTRVPGPWISKDVELKRSCWWKT